MSTCNSIGNIVVGGTVVGQLRCGGRAGHHLPDMDGDRELSEGTPHWATFTWADGELGADWPEALDPDEGFDVEVDAIDGQPVNGTDEGDGQTATRASIDEAQPARGESST